MKERPRSRASSREACKEWIIDTLEERNGQMMLRSLHDLAESCGYTDGTMKHAKEELGRVDGALINPEKVGCMVGEMLGMFASGNGAASDNRALFSWAEYQDL